MLQVYLRYMLIGNPNNEDKQEIVNNPKFTSINRSLMQMVEQCEGDKELQSSSVVQKYCDNIYNIVSKGLNEVNNDIFYDKYFMIDDIGVIITDNSNKYYADIGLGMGYIEVNDNHNKKSIFFGKDDPDDLIRVLKTNNVQLDNSTSHVKVDIIGWHRGEPICCLFPPN